MNGYVERDARGDGRGRHNYNINKTIFSGMVWRNMSNKGKWDYLSKIPVTQLVDMDKLDRSAVSVLDVSIN